MNDINLFSPFILDVAHGDYRQRMVFGERMCIFYELELLHGDEHCGGVITLDQFVSARDGVLFLRRPGDIVNGITPYSFACIVFDTIYDPQFGDYYAEPNVKGHPVDLQLLDRLKRSPSHRFDFLDRIPRVMHTTRDTELTREMRQIIELENCAEPEQRLLARAQLTQLLVKLSLRSDNEGQLFSDTPRAVIRMQRYIVRHYTEKLTLEQLAEAVSLSREYLCRLFLKHAGTTPVGYLHQVRVYHASMMLMTTEMAVEDIALSVGFQSASHFYRVFRKHTGMTPAEYRRMRLPGELGRHANAAVRPQGAK